MTRIVLGIFLIVGCYALAFWMAFLAHCRSAKTSPETQIEDWVDSGSDWLDSPDWDYYSAEDHDFHH